MPWASGRNGGTNLGKKNRAGRIPARCALVALSGEGRRNLLYQVHVTVSSAAGASEVEAADLGVLVADPDLTLGAGDELDGASAGLNDSTTDATRPILRHFSLLVVERMILVCPSVV